MVLYIQKQTNGMNWGKSIVLAFVSFAIFIGVLTAVCMRQEVSLVSKDYYEQELDYQSQINRLNNTQQLSDKPEIRVSNGSLKISFQTTSQLDEGELKLFRPSDTRFDKKFALQKFTDQNQSFDVSQFPKGMYRAQMQWTMNGKEYYIEQVINL